MREREREKEKPQTRLVNNFKKIHFRVEINIDLEIKTQN